MLTWTNIRSTVGPATIIRNKLTKPLPAAIKITSHKIAIGYPSSFIKSGIKGNWNSAVKGTISRLIK